VTRTGVRPSREPGCLSHLRIAGSCRDGGAHFARRACGDGRPEQPQGERKVGNGAASKGSCSTGMLHRMLACFRPSSPTFGGTPSHCGAALLPPPLKQPPPQNTHTHTHTHTHRLHRPPGCALSHESSGPNRSSTGTGSSHSSPPAAGSRHRVQWKMSVCAWWYEYEGRKRGGSHSGGSGGGGGGGGGGQRRQ
jgi:hypothetical protein